MAYLNSEDIGVFPATRRSADYQLKSRRFTEESVTRLTHTIADKSYVITDNNVNTGKFDSDKPFEFVIKGYYFKVSAGSKLTTLVGDTVYATLQKYNGGSFDEIKGDNGTTYEGVAFSASSSDGALQLLDNRSIPATSRVRFSDAVLGTTEIDGGTI